MIPDSTVLKDSRPRLIGLVLPVWLGVLGIAAAVFLLAVVPREMERARERVRHELELLADVRETALSAWARHALADAHTVATFPTAAALLSRHPAFAPDPRFHQILSDFADIHEFRSIRLLDRDLLPRFSTLDTLPETADARALAAAAVARGRDTLEFVRDANGRAVVLSIALAPHGLGCVVAALDPYRWLYVLLEPAPMGLGSGEALLVRREAAGVRALSPGAGARIAPLALLPASVRGGAADAWDASERPFVRGLDDRGRAALAYHRPLRGQSWTLVLKVDEAEALAGVRAESTRTGLGLFALLTALTALAFAMLWGQRRAHEVEAARSRSRLAILVDQANEAMGYMTPDGIIRQTNRSAEAFFGVPGGLVGHHAWDLQPPGGGPSLAEISQIMARDGRATFESEAMTASGERLPIEVSLRAVALDGETLWVARIGDLRDRREAERRIRRLNRLLRATAAVAVQIQHEDDERPLCMNACRLAVEIGDFLIANVALERPGGGVDLGYMVCQPPLTIEDVPARTRPATANHGPSSLAIRSGRSVLIRDLGDARLEPDVRENFVLIGAHSCGSSPIRVRGVVRGAFTLFSRHEAAFDEEAMALIDGTAAELGKAMGAIEDRRAFARVEQRLGALFAAGPVGFMVADHAGVVTHANPEFLRITGRSASDLAAGRILAKDIGPESLQGDAGPEGGAAPAPFETELLRPGGDRVPVLVGRMHLHHADDETLAVVLDTTELHQTAESLRQTQMQLFQAQKMETIGQLAGGVAHDFNNLLTVIHGYAELLRGGRDSDDADTPAIDQILRAAERASMLTRQLLAFSRRQVLEPRRLDVGALLRDSATMLRRLIGADVALEVTCADPVGPVMADPGQVEQVLLNLVVNARDAMPAGGRVRIEAGEVLVDAAWAEAHPPIPAGTYVRITVSDDGSGIPEELLPHIFEPFFTTKEVGKGTGLGLATVYGIIKQSGGYVFVTSELGVGTSFEILLPRAESGPQANPARGPLASRPSSG